MPAVEAARLTVTPDPAPTTRDEVVAALARAVTSLPIGHPIRVGVDGWSHAVETTLTDELAAAIEATWRALDCCGSRIRKHPKAVSFTRL